MPLERVWCPYCHEGNGCMVEGDKITCPVCHRTFTIQQSCDDIKNGGYKK